MDAITEAVEAFEIELASVVRMIAASLWLPLRSAASLVRQAAITISSTSLADFLRVYVAIRNSKLYGPLKARLR